MSKRRAEAGVLAEARDRVLQDGSGLDYKRVLACLQLPDEAVPDLLALAHEVRYRWCGDEIDVESIVSVKTGGCPEDCHFFISEPPLPRTRYRARVASPSTPSTAWST
jgi:biotin synthase